jgi:hypothetical protein
LKFLTSGTDVRPSSTELIATLSIICSVPLQTISLTVPVFIQQRIEGRQEKETEVDKCESQYPNSIYSSHKSGEGASAICSRLWLEKAQHRAKYICVQYRIVYRLVCSRKNRYGSCQRERNRKRPCQ